MSDKHEQDKGMAAAALLDMIEASASKLGMYIHSEAYTHSKAYRIVMLVEQIRQENNLGMSNE